MKWVRHKSKKASHILKESFPGEWEQSICGCFFMQTCLWRIIRQVNAKDV